MKLTISAPAKINVVLEICRTLPDGYHELDTVFQELALADSLEACLSQETDLRLIDEVQSGFSVEVNEDNLVLKALRRLEKLAGRPLPTQFTLTKRIPAGGGLGGGSADAAAALKAVNQLYQLNLSPETLQREAAALGADVAFGLVLGTARGRGKGELLQPLPRLPRLNLVLLIPKFGLSTPAVYRHLDGLPEAGHRPARGCAQKLTEILHQGGDSLAVESCLGNDLQPAASDMRPELKEIERRMLAAGCRSVLLCGSGSTMFGTLTDPAQSQEVCARLADLGRTLFTHTV